MTTGGKTCDTQDADLTELLATCFDLCAAFIKDYVYVAYWDLLLLYISVTVGYCWCINCYYQAVYLCVPMEGTASWQAQSLVSSNDVLTRLMQINCWVVMGSYLTATFLLVYTTPLV